jgi:hypothetical protein|nr:MAG TPA: Transcriptional regulator, RHH-like, CopG [Caudoviricetes sp.]
MSNTTTRDNLLLVKMTDGEKEQIRQAAGLRGLTMSAYVRMVLLAAAGKEKGE